MFSRIILHNFKSLPDIDFDLGGTNGRPIPIAMVFGENGSGKTDLIESVRFLKGTARIYGGLPDESPETGVLHPNRTGTATTGIQALVNVYRMINTEEMSVRYFFKIGRASTEYFMSFDKEGRVVGEELRSLIGSRTGRYYRISSDGNGISIRMSPSFITDTKYRREIEYLIRGYWGNNTLMGIMNNQYSVKDESFMSGAVISGFDRIRKYIDSVMVDLPSEDAPLEWPHNVWDGWTESSTRGDIERFERAFDRFFTSVCTDIRHVRYEFEEKGNRIHYSLVFDQMISGRKHSIPYSLQSSGIKKLARLMPLLAGCADGKTVFIDGLDSGIHDKMIADIFSEITDSVSGQLVFTTHNTGLLESADPKSVFIISIDISGFKMVHSINKITGARKNRNYREKYLNGKYYGVPYLGYLDIKDVAGKLITPIGDADEH